MNKQKYLLEEVDIYLKNSVFYATYFYKRSSDN